MRVLGELYGRARELDVLARWAAGEGPSRLLLWGPPGIGKSALLATLAHTAHECWFVDCAQIETLEQLCFALSAQRESGRGQAPPPVITLEALEGALAPLIFLDHAEALGADVVTALNGPTRWLIATQQQLPGERCMRLDGLATDAARQLLAVSEDAPDHAPMIEALITHCEGSPPRGAPLRAHVPWRAA